MLGFRNVVWYHCSLSFCSSSDTHTTSCLQHCHSHTHLFKLVLCSSSRFSRKRETACSLDRSPLNPSFFHSWPSVPYPPPSFSISLPPINSPLVSPQSLKHSSLDFDSPFFIFVTLWFIIYKVFFLIPKKKSQAQFCLFIKELSRYWKAVSFCWSSATSCNKIFRAFYWVLVNIGVSWLGTNWHGWRKC